MTIWTCPECLLGRFDIFAAGSVIRQELHHSDFLGFVLHPLESHEMRATFVERLLPMVL